MQQETKVATVYKDTSHPVHTLRGKPVNAWLVLVSLIFGFFMSLLDVTIVNIAIPSIQSNLKTDLTTVTWVLNAYSLVFAILLVTMGRFADQFGRKRIFMLGMIIFSLGSLLCALSPTMALLTGWPAIHWLIGFRAFQAIGAAAMNPVSLAIIIAVFPRERRGAAIGVWGALSGLAAAAGPVLGGFLVQNFDWRWIFFVNLPFCIVGLFMVALFVPETREQGTSKKLDPLGLLTLSIAMFCLVLAIIQGNDWGWTSTPILSLFAGALVALILFFIVESRVSEPIVDFSLFKIRNFSASSIAIFLFGIAIQGAFLILVLYFIDAQGYTQLDAAYAILPIPLASFVVSAFSGAFSQKINPRISGMVGMALLVVGFIALATLNVNSTFLDTTWRGLIIGAGMGLCFQSFPNMALSEVPRAKLGVGSGVFNTFRQIGFVLGVAILISLFIGQIKTNVQQATTNSIQIVQNNTSIPAQFHQPIINGLQSAGSDANSSQVKPQSVDLTQFAQYAPPQYREQARANLKVLGDQIAAEFKNAVINAFTATWIAAAMFALLGLVGAFFTRMPSRKVAARSQDGKPVEEMEVPAVS
jgi:EmrB/QacA subfamily drug resistance transporter